ncbi:MAG: hypothetical protein AB7V43_07115 [Acidimicrobiia bacterium]
MECADLAAHLTEFLEGDLDDDMEAAALDHLASCEQCEVVLAQTRMVIDLSGRHGRAVLERSERDALLRRILDATRNSR